MSGLRLALNPSDLDETVDFHMKHFGTEPANLRPGYANFAIADPPLKLVLMEDATSRGHGIGGALNHLSVEVETTDEVVAATACLSDEGLKMEIENQTKCCLAIEDQVWVNHPNGAPWEVYSLTADAPAESGIAGKCACCVPAAIQGVPAAAVGDRLESSACC